MNPEQKTRLLIGTLSAAVVIVVGYGLYQALGQAPVALVPPTAQAISPDASSTPASVPGMPPISIQADSPVPANTGDHQASITPDSGLSYEWSIQGGTIEGDNHGSAISWTAGAGTATVLTCKATDAAGRTGSAVFRVPLGQPPTISRFEATPLVITEGSSARLSWTASGVQKLVLEPGGQDVSQYTGPAMDVKPEKTTTYTLTATSRSGLTVTRELQLKVVPPPEITALRAEPVSGSTSAFTVTGEFKGGKAELKSGGQVVASGDASPLRIQMPDLKEGSSLVFTVTNEAGTYVASTLNFSVKK